MKNFPYFLQAFLLIFLASCSSQNKETQTTNTDSTAVDTTQIDAAYLCVPYQQFGKILPTHTLQDLETIFGKENIGVDSLFAEGTYVGLQTVIFKGKPEEVFVSWQEQEQPFLRILQVITAQDGSPYKTKEGLSSASNLNDLVKANDGKVLSFSGFDWDYGGSCCEGFSEKLKGLGFNLEFAEPQNPLTDEERSSISGDQTVRSDNPVFQKNTVNVLEMRVSLNQYQE